MGIFHYDSLIFIHNFSIEMLWQGKRLHYFFSEKCINAGNPIHEIKSQYDIMHLNYHNYIIQEGNISGIFQSRGFVGKRKQDGPSNRIPPGQYLTHDFPVLSAEPTPRTPLERWSLE